MIRLTNVNKYFNKRKSNEIHVINNTSIELEDKGLVAFLGNSGCGKTTLLNAIGGLDKVDSGEIYIDNQRLTKRRDGKKDEIRNEYIGYIFQNYNLIEDRSVFFNVEIVLRMMGVKDKEEIKKRVLFILEKTGIERYKNRPVKALSGGERQRVGIARALVKNPKIIIADEPTGNLDSRNTIEIMNIIKAVSREKLVILVTHERNLAEFYASRIVELVDGKIVKDTVNETSDELEYHMENRIFLQDMAVQQKISADNVTVNYYSDRKDKPLELKVVVKNNNIYVELPDGYGQGAETTELVDGHYEKISRDIYENYSFDYKDIEGKKGKIRYTSVFSFWKILAEGYRKIFSYSIVKKILLLGFIFSAIMTMVSVSNIAASRDIHDEEFMTVNKNYLTVETGKLSPEVYNRYKNMEGIDYVIPGTGRMSLVFPLDDYYQSSGSVAEGSASSADKDMITEEMLIAGRLPEKRNEVLLDKMVADSVINDGIIKQVGVVSAEGFVGRKINGGSAGELVITGICNSGSPSVYMDRSNLIRVMTGIPSESEETTKYPVADYREELEKGNIKLAAGELPEEDNEVMVPYDMYGIYYVGSTTDIKVNGEKLIVSGFYEDRIPGRDTSYVSSSTMKNAIIENCSEIVLSPADKETSLMELQEKHVKVIDNYEKERTEYVKQMRESMISSIIAAMVILIISIIEIYLILRASFLSRIREVGVLRAIGLKKKDVYKMFLGEILAVTTMTTLPSLVVTAYILENIEGIPFLGENILMNPEVFIISTIILLLSNLIFGLLPVFNTMRKTPSAILARNDIN